MSWQVPQAQLIAVLLAGVRAAAWLTVCPPFAGPMLPGPIKALLSIALALPVAGPLTAQAATLGTDNGAVLLVAAIEQVAIGTALGFITALFFAAAQAAGDLIDVFGGFSLAFALDPLGINQSSIFGRFYHVIALTILFVTDGYQLVIRGFLQSYQALPLSGTLSLGTLDRVLTQGIAQLFVAAIQIAGPLLAVLFCADIALGLLNRAAPALNAFSMGFPAKILLVLTLGGTAIALLPRAVHALIVPAVTAVVRVAGGG
jgi:flagellar biosynthesis protein FliR